MNQLDAYNKLLARMITYADSIKPERVTLDKAGDNLFVRVKVWPADMDKTAATSHVFSWKELMRAPAYDTVTGRIDELVEDLREFVATEQSKKETKT